MRIDSMDAALKPTASIVTAQMKKEVPVDAVNSVSTQAKEIPKENTKEDSIRAATEEISDAFLQRAIDRANYTFEIQNRSLRFKIHEKTNEIMVKIIDTETKEVIREIPPEKLMDMFANMLELAGLLVDERR